MSCAAPSRPTAPWSSSEPQPTAVAARDRGAVVVWAVAPLFAAAILLGVLFFFAHRAGRRAVNDLEFKLEHPPTAAVRVVAPPPAADVELVAP